MSKALTKYDNICLVIFTRESGARLCIARMFLLDDQIDFAARIGCSQGALSKVERGLQAGLGVTLGDLRRALGKHLDFVLFGTNAEYYARPAVKRMYWEERIRGSRSNARKREKWEERMAIFREKRQQKRESKPIKKVMLTDHLLGED